MESLFFNEILAFGSFLSLKNSKNFKAKALFFLTLEAVGESDDPPYLIELAGTQNETYLGYSFISGLNKFKGFTFF